MRKKCELSHDMVFLIRLTHITVKVVHVTDPLRIHTDQQYKQQTSSIYPVHQMMAWWQLRVSLTETMVEFFQHLKKTVNALYAYWLYWLLSIPLWFLSVQHLKQAVNDTICRPVQQMKHADPFPWSWWMTSATYHLTDQLHQLRKGQHQTAPGSSHTTSNDNSIQSNRHNHDSTRYADDWWNIDIFPNVQHFIEDIIKSFK